MGGGFGTLDKGVNRRYFLDSFATATKKRDLFRRDELKNLPLQSSMVAASQAWNALSSGDKTSWGTAGAYSGLSAYNAFLQDKILRIMAGLSGNASPSNYHQGLVGSLVIPQGAGHFLVRMIGNTTFTGTGTLKTSYKSALTEEDGGGGYVKVRFNYRYDAGAGPVMSSTERSLVLSQAWTSVTNSVSNLATQEGYWELEIEGDAVYGSLLFDNFYMSVASGIITKDFKCEDVSRLFFPIILPAQITFESLYPN